MINESSIKHVLSVTKIVKDTKYIKVQRIIAQSDHFEIELDINADIFTMNLNKKYEFTLSKNFDKNKDKCNYAMYGIIFKIEFDDAK